ncbi:MAG: hypothetical protein FJY88_05365 [Candidatus Eisenbacteria bacterium]|nr:hypothetical protein [Candidatus Eisenbacteria bacterium]
MGTTSECRRILSWIAAAAALALLPISVSSAPDPRYVSCGEIDSLFSHWEAVHPAIFHREVIGHSGVLGLPIWAARISDNAGVHEEEPVIVFNAAQHANEANGTNAIIWMMDRLLDRYSKDPVIASYVNALEIWFVPIVNVDGHTMVFSEAPDWRLWRKNLRDNDDNAAFTCPEDGVDLNRNWDFRWEEDDSTSTSSYYYKGPGAFSEQEVVALRDLIWRERPALTMDYHSPFTTGPGNVIYWPWRNSANGRYGPDSAAYRAISQNLALHTRAEADSLRYNGNTPSRNVLPKQQNWVYANTGACALLMEIALTPWWEGKMVDTVAARVGRGSMYLLARAAAGPGLAGKVTDQETGLPLVAEVRIEEAHDPAVGPRLTDPRSGGFWRLMQLGDFTMTVRADGYYQVTRPVQVSVGWTHANTELRRMDPAFADAMRPSPAQRLWTTQPHRPGEPIYYRVDRPGPVRLDLLEASGRRVLTLTEGVRPAGVAAASIDRRLAPGVYFLRLDTVGATTTSKLVTAR